MVKHRLCKHTFTQRFENDPHGHRTIYLFIQSTVLPVSHTCKQPFLKMPNVQLHVYFHGYRTSVINTICGTHAVLTMSYSIINANNVSKKAQRLAFPMVIEHLLFIPSTSLPMSHTCKQRFSKGSKFKYSHGHRRSIIYTIYVTAHVSYIQTTFQKRPKL